MNRFLLSTNYLKDGFAAPGSIQPRSDNGGSNVVVSCGITEVILKYFLKFVYFWKKWPIKPISGIKCHWWLLLTIFLMLFQWSLQRLTYVLQILVNPKFGFLLQF